MYNEQNRGYESMTISTQILPEEYPRFCEKLSYYISVELREYEKLSERHKRYAKKFYGKVPDYPTGIVDDIMVVFQHEPSFEVAKAKWERRKKRIDFDSIAYLFQVYNPSYTRYAKQFIKLNLPHSICLTEGFELPGAYRFDVPEGADGFGWHDGKKYIEDNFSIAEWLEI